MHPSLDPAWLEAQYNNRARVPTFARHLTQWTERSRQARADWGGTFDLRYGEAEAETLDVFGPRGPIPAGGAPVLFFLHGGYWRSLDKADHSFIAPPFVAKGVCVVVPNHTLCPRVDMSTLVRQVERALVWVLRHVAAHGGDPRRVVVAGHSAGGHLAARLLSLDGARWGADIPSDPIAHALSISGLHDLAPLRLTPFLQADLRLTETQVEAESPARLPPPRVQNGRGRLTAVVGGEESEAFVQQARQIQAAWGHEVVPVCEVLPGLHHFSVLEALAEPGQRLHTLALEALGV